MTRYLAFLVVPAVLLGACASVPAPGSNDLKDGTEVTSEDLGNALATPFRDINLVREEIPAVLMAAMRAAIAKGRFEAFRKDFHSRLAGGAERV